MFSVARLLFAAALVVATSTPGFAQFRRFSPGIETGERSLPLNRDVVLELRRAERELAEGDYAKAIARLQLILYDAEDFLILEHDGMSIRERVHRILRDLPEAGQRIYEQTYGQTAQSLVQQALEGDDPDILQEVVRRYFHTSAGGVAAWQQARRARDRGHQLMAARWFDRLRRDHSIAERSKRELTESAALSWWQAGEPGRGAECLLELIAASHEPRLNGKQVPLLTELEEAKHWMEANLGVPAASVDHPVRDWPMAGGRLQRDASFHSGTPIWDSEWVRPVIERSEAGTDEQYEELLTEIESLHYRGNGLLRPTAIPMHAPIVTGQTLIFGSYGYMSGVDVDTGRLLWKTYEPDDTFSYLIKTASQFNSGSPLGAQASPPLTAFFEQRAWRDQTSAALSTDGKHVFVIKDSGLAGALNQGVVSTQIGNHPLRADSHNLMRAYEVGGGRLKWEAGGPRERVSLPLAGTFFLGAPLPVNGRLYVLGEESGQVRLLALDPETGELDWSMALVNAGASINDALRRRLGGLSPAYSPDSDLLICPTGCGVVLAVELSTRTLVWSAEYESRETDNPLLYETVRPLPLGGHLVEMIGPETLLAEERWLDTALRICGNDILLTAPDSDALCCLHIADGRVVWTTPRESSLFVAGCCAETVALVGRQNLQGLQRDNGRRLWSLEIPEPSGRGVRTGDRYHLPLATAEVATVDLRAGRLLARSPTRSGQPLGNLIAAAGRLFSQTPSTVSAFRDVEDLREQIASDLERDPQGPAALAARGEMRLHEGDIERGLVDLRQSLAGQAHLRVEQLIVSTLLEGLRVDFPGHRDSIDEIDRLARDPQQRLLFLRTVASGLERSGELLPAYDRYLQLALTPTTEQSMELLGPDYRVRSDCATVGKLQELGMRLRDQHPQDFAQRVEDVIQDALKRNEPLVMERALELYREHSDADHLRLRLADHWISAGSPLRSESLLLSLRASTDPAVQGQATALLARLYATQEQGELASAMLNEVEERWGDVECLPGKEGRTLAQEWRADAVLGPQFANVPDWPVANVEVRSQVHSSTTGRIPIPFDGPLEGEISGWSFSLEGDKLVACDGFGRRQWSHSLGESSPSSFPTAQYVTVRGHLILVFLGDRFVLLDAMRPGAPRVVIESLVTEATGGPSSPWRTHHIIQTPNEGLRVNHRQSTTTRRFVGNVGPLCERQFCYLQGEVLRAIDPTTGEELWSRSGIEHGSEILADDDYVILCPPQMVNRRVRRLRAADGADAGPMLNLPLSVQTSRQGADWGCLFLTVDRADAGYAIGMYDPIREVQVWEREVDEEFYWAPADGRDIVVLEGDGQLAVINATSGEDILRTTVEAPARLESISVLSTPSHWYVLPHMPMAPMAVGRLFLPNVRYELLPVNGKVHALNRFTKQLDWSKQLTNQAIDPQLPGRWPVLVFDAPIRSPQRTGERLFAGNMQYQTVQILSAQDGSLVHEENVQNEWRGIDWRVSDKGIRLLFGGTEITLDFQDPPDSEGAEPAAPATDSDENGLPAPPGDPVQQDEGAGESPS